VNDARDGYARAGAVRLIRSPHEEKALAFVIEKIRPFCATLVHGEKCEFKSNGLRPDLMLRLTALPEIWLAVEVKRFDSSFSDLPAAIAQAASYAETTRSAAFVAPLAAKNATALAWHQGPVGAALLVAGQFNVGALCFSEHQAMLTLSGVVVAYLHDGGQTQLHPNAARLLEFKTRFGSSAKRMEHKP
jgi:hypothetical protein